MANNDVLDALQRYLEVLPDYGIHAHRLILFGSYVNGHPTEWSDIDVIVLAPEFDQPYDSSTVSQLWRAVAKADSRIEPVACGEQEWETDDARPILEIARQDGIEISLDSGELDVKPRTAARIMTGTVADSKRIELSEETVFPVGAPVRIRIEELDPTDEYAPVLADYYRNCTEEGREEERTQAEELSAADAPLPE